MNIEPLSVGRLVDAIKSKLESSFRDVVLEGEVSNLSLSSSGHWYLTLSDKDASISAAVFKMDAMRNPIMQRLKDGDKVLVHGDINVYPKRGSFQIIIKKILPKGVGDLKEQFEKLKKKLAAEGLFDLANKKKIPEMPKRIAVITALRGAALQDFLNIYQRRSFWMDIVIIPTLVQGDEAPKALRKSLFNAIKYSLEAPEHKKFDLILITRGGGSMEDLWAFNDEGLAWDIFNCPIPVISAVGHEVDFSICDFVSDLRLETPSAAAEVLTQKQSIIVSKMRDLRNKLRNEMRYFLQHVSEKIEKRKPKNVLSLIIKKLANFQQKLNRADLSKRFIELSGLYDYQMDLEDKLKRIQRWSEKAINERETKLQKMDSLLVAYNPKNVLGRGYAYLEVDKKVVLDTLVFDSLKPKQKMTIHLHDGERTVVKE